MCIELQILQHYGCWQVWPMHSWIRVQLWHSRVCWWVMFISALTNNLHRNF